MFKNLFAKIYNKNQKESDSSFDFSFGLTEEIVRGISKDKEEPDWMLGKRLEAFNLYKNTPMPNWGPDLSELKLKEIIYYVPSDLKEQNSWSEVPK